MVEEPPPIASFTFVEPTFAQRILARLIDTAVLLPLALLFGILLKGKLSAVLGLIVGAVYEIVLVARRGQTLGKATMGTRIVNRESGALPDTLHVALRWLVLSAGSLVALVVPEVANLNVAYLIAVLFPVLRPPLHRGLHDRAAATVVTSLRVATPARET